MPFYEDVECHLSEMLDSERQQCAIRIAKQEDRTRCTRDAASLQVKQAAVEADRLVNIEQDHGKWAVENAQARLDADLAKFAAELSRAKEHAALASQQCAERLRAAETQRDAQRPVVNDRIAKAELACQAAVAAAEADAAQAEAQAQARIADAERRAQGREEYAQRVQDEAEAKEAARVSEAEQRVATLEADAMRRAERVQHAAADKLEVQLQRVREWLLHVPREWAITENRVAKELKMGERRQELEQVTIDGNARRCERSIQRADEVLAVAEAASAELHRVQYERTTREMQCVAEQVNAFHGLEELVQSLRSGALWRDLQAGTREPPK